MEKTLLPRSKKISLLVTRIFHYAGVMRLSPSNLCPQFHLFILAEIQWFLLLQMVQVGSALASLLLIFGELREHGHGGHCRHCSCFVPLQLGWVCWGFWRLLWKIDGSLFIFWFIWYRRKVWGSGEGVATQARPILKSIQRSQSVVISLTF